MALDGTYTGLKASIADFLSRADLTAAIPDFITLAEAQMARRFVLRQNAGLSVPRRLVKRSDTSIALAQEYISVPSDMIGPLRFVLNSDPVRELDYYDGVAFEREKVRRARITTTVGPQIYTVVGEQFQILNVADQAYTAELVYLARWATLSDANPNWIIQQFPDAYLYGALLQSAPYLKNDGRLTVWGNFFTQAIDDICNADPMPTSKAKMRSDIPIMGRRYSAPNLLTNC